MFFRKYTHSPALSQLSARSRSSRINLCLLTRGDHPEHFFITENFYFDLPKWIFCETFRGVTTEAHLSVEWATSGDDCRTKRLS